jgi:hypothetical protein
MGGWCVTGIELFNFPINSSTNPILLSTYFPLANYVNRSLEESIASSMKYKNDC